jgi:hypothetical protein
MTVLLFLFLTTGIYNVGVNLGNVLLCFLTTDILNVEEGGT